MTMPPPPAFGAEVPPVFSQTLPMYNALPSYTAAAPPPAFAAALSAPTPMHGLQAYDTTADGRADSVDTTGDGLADSVVLPRTASIEAILAERRRASAGPLSPHTRPFPAPPQITQPPPPLPALQVCVGLPAVAAPPEAEGRLAAIVADSPDHAIMVAVQNHSTTEWLTLRAGSVEPHRSKWLLGCFTLARCEHATNANVACVRLQLPQNIYAITAKYIRNWAACRPVGDLEVGWVVLRIAKAQRRERRQRAVHASRVRPSGPSWRRRHHAHTDRVPIATDSTRSKHVSSNRYRGTGPAR